MRWGVIAVACWRSGAAARSSSRAWQLGRLGQRVGRPLLGRRPVGSDLDAFDEQVVEEVVVGARRKGRRAITHGMHARTPQQAHKLDYQEISGS